MAEANPLDRLLRPTLRVYLVRLAVDQDRPRELVGIFAARDVAHLCEFIDLCCNAWDCEYTELGAGGIYWPNFMDRAIPTRVDWDSVLDDYSLLPSEATLSDGEWWEAFVEDGRRWTRITYEMMSSPNDDEDDFTPTEDDADTTQRGNNKSGAWPRRRTRR